MHRLRASPLGYLNLHLASELGAPSWHPANGFAAQPLTADPHQPDLAYCRASACQMRDVAQTCAGAYMAMATLFEQHARLVAEAAGSATLSLSAQQLCASLRRQLQVDEEILLPALLQSITGQRAEAGVGAQELAIDRAAFEHVRADHAGCLALLERLEWFAPDPQHPDREDDRDATVAVLRAYALPHLQEQISLCPRLAAAGVDTRAMQHRMAARHRELAESGPDDAEQPDPFVVTPPPS